MLMSVPPSGQPPVPEQIAFDRAELSVILSIYGRMVAAGEWRDYAMSFLREVNAAASAKGISCARWTRSTG